MQLDVAVYYTVLEDYTAGKHPCDSGLLMHQVGTEEAEAEVLKLLAARLEALVERRASSLAASFSQEVRGPACRRSRPILLRLVICAGCEFHFLL